MAAEGNNSTSRKVPWWVKLAYAAPSFAGSAMVIPLTVTMPKFYSDTVMVPLAFIAIGIAIARSIDAITDPLVGWMSDHTKSRWGRRKPWVLAGAPLAALLFYLLLSPPEWLTPQQAGIWFAVLFSIYFIAQTIEAVPALSWGAELSPDYNERSSIYAVRAFLIAIGTLVAAVFPNFLTAFLGDGNQRQVFQIMAVFYAILYVLTILIQVKVVPRNPEFDKSEGNPLVPGLRRALRNKPFKVIMLSAVMTAIPAAVPAVLVPFFVEHIIKADDPNKWVGIFLFAYLFFGLLFVPFWYWATKRFGKSKAMILANTWSLFGGVAMYFVGPMGVGPALVLFTLMGASSMTIHVVIPSMLADAIDYDELLTGKRREGQYTAFYNVVLKFVSIPASSIPLGVLALSGYVPGPVQTEKVLFTINAMTTLFPAIFSFGGIVVISRYRLTGQVHQNIQHGIAAHKKGQSCVDPLSQTVIEPPQSQETLIDDNTAWFLDNFSPDELREAVSGKPKILMHKVYRSMAVTLTLFAICLTLTLSSINNMTDNGVDGMLGVIYIVAAGLSLTAFAFHAFRLNAARKFVKNPPADNVVETHLRLQSRIEASVAGAV